MTSFFSFVQGVREEHMSEQNARARETWIIGYARGTPKISDMVVGLSGE